VVLEAEDVVALAETEGVKVVEEEDAMVAEEEVGVRVAEGVAEGVEGEGEDVKATKWQH
jgi:hypothetical protein